MNCSSESTSSACIPDIQQLHMKSNGVLKCQNMAQVKIDVGGDGGLKTFDITTFLHGGHDFSGMKRRGSEGGMFEL